MNLQEAIRAATERIVLPPEEELEPDVEPHPIADAIETAVRVGRHRA